MNRSALPTALELVTHPASAATARSLLPLENSGGAFLAYGTSVPNAVAGYVKGGLFIDTAVGLYVNTGSATSCTFTALVTALTVTLDGAFDAGKTIDGATSAANAFQVGDGTDDIRIYVNAANDCRIDTEDGAALSLRPAGNLTLVPAGGTTAITGAVTVSTTLNVTGTTTLGVLAAGASTLDSLTVTGAASIGSLSLNAVAPAGAGTTLALDGATTGGVTIGATSTGNIALQRNITTAASRSLTMTGVDGSNILVVTAGDVAVSNGSLSVTDTDNAAGVVIVNNTITTASLVTIDSTSLTTGDVVAITADGVTSGNLLHLVTSSAGFTGKFIVCETAPAAADGFSVGLAGAVVIGGTASTDELTITAGDLQITAGDIDLDLGFITVDNTADESNYFKRNFNGAGTAAVLEIESTHASSTKEALLIDHNGTGASLAVVVDHEGTADCITITSLAASASLIKATAEAATGTVLEIIGAASSTVAALSFANSGTGATGFLGAAGVGMLQITCDGNLASDTASCLLITYSGAGAATGLGTALRIIDTGATATSVAVYISAATGEALNVAVGQATFAETVNLGTGLTFTTTGAVISEDATNTNWNAGAANETLNFGPTTALDVVFHGSGAAGEDCTWDSSASALEFSGGSALVLPQGATSGGTGRQEVTGSIFYETVAKKLWVYDGVGWVGVVLA